MQKALLLLAATALVAATPAADLDKNGKVSRAEFMAASDARFAAADADFNGQLTRDEMKALGEARRTEHAKGRFSNMDANGDGVVSEAEMLASRDSRPPRGPRAEGPEGQGPEGRGPKGEKGDRRAKMLEQFDTNSDGELSDAERAVARKLHEAKRGERKAEKKVARAERPRLDANRDGLVTKAEYDAMGEALFLRMDANGDGVLTKGEGQKRKGPKGPSKGDGPRR